MSISSDTQQQMYEAYASSYTIFLKNWQTQRQAALDMLEKHFKSNLSQQTEVSSVLSVGPGPGEFDKQLIQFLQQYVPEGQTLFDQNSEEGRVLMDFLFQANLRNASSELNQRLLSLVDEVAFEQNGHKMLNLPTVTFLIPKQ
jgi:hypothetical protein